jgi:hypothetical protein
LDLQGHDAAAASRGAIGAGGQVDAIIPRFRLPDDWSGKGACPVCLTPGQLRVQHHEAAPDWMVCGYCGTAFEVETGGTRIRLAAAPPALGQTALDLLNIWLAPSELPTLIERALPVDSNSPFEQPSAAVAAAISEPAPATALAAELPTAAVVTDQTDTVLAPPTTAPPAPKASNGAAAEPEPGTDDWFATLAAAMGGLLPVRPPPDSVLADELELALTSRPGTGANGSVEPAPEPIATLASAMDTAISAPPVTGQAPAPVVASVAEAKAPAPEPAKPFASTLTVSPEPVALIPNYRAEPPITPVVESAIVLAAVSPAAPATASTSRRRELAERAWKLHELGNSLPSIQATLEGSGAVPEDLAVIMGKLDALRQAREARFRRTLQWVIGGALLVLVVLLAIAAVLSRGPAPAVPAATPVSSVAPGLVTAGGKATPIGTPMPGQAAATVTLAYNPIIGLLNRLLPGDVKIANGPSATPAATSALVGALFPPTATLSPADLATEDAKKSSLPSWVSTLVPSGITVHDVPTPSVNPNGPPKSLCPLTADQASALFGGSAASWTFSRQQHGWIFILADYPATIRIPANMSAGYLVIGQTLEMRSVVGPATVHNVNFIAVACD